MAVITHDAKLNDLLVDLGRSLLQYAAESSVWNRNPEVGAELVSLAARQQAYVARLAELLAARGWPIDFGGYPTEYTDLHFLSVDFFLPRLIAAEEALVSELDECVHTCIDDPEAVELLRAVHAGEQDILAHLKKLTPAPGLVTSPGARNCETPTDKL